MIEMDEKPAEAVRAKPNSSLVAACRAVGGGTGRRRRLGGQHRRDARRRPARAPPASRASCGPAIAVPIPAQARPIGPASTRARTPTRGPSTSLQFAHMGVVFAEEILEHREARGPAALDRRGAGEGQPARRSRRTGCSPRATSTSPATPRAATCSDGGGDVVVTRRLHGQRRAEAARGNDHDAARAPARGDHRDRAGQARRPADPAGGAAAPRRGSTRTPTAARTCSACAASP